MKLTPDVRFVAMEPQHLLEHRFIKAACTGSIREIEKYIFIGGDVNFIDHDKYASALIWASCNGKLNVVKTLIENGADLNIRSKAGRTALHAACFDGYKDIVELLVGNGADVSIKTNTGRV